MSKPITEIKVDLLEMSYLTVDQAELIRKKDRVVWLRRQLEEKLSDREADLLRQQLNDTLKEIEIISEREARQAKLIRKREWCDWLSRQLENTQNKHEADLLQHQLNDALEEVELISNCEEVIDKTKEMLSGITRSHRFGNEMILKRIDSYNYHQSFVIEVATNYDEIAGRFVFKTYGYLHFDTPNKNRPYIYVKVLNEALYDPYLLSCRFRVEQLLGLEFHGITKLDIAVDANVDFVKRFMSYYTCPDYVFVIFDKDRKYNDEYVENLTFAETGSRMHPLKHKGFYIKSSHTKNGKTSQKTGMLARCYNKTLEIDKSSGKDEIKLASTIADNDIMYRLEVSLNNHKQIEKSLNIINRDNSKNNVSPMLEEEIYSNIQNPYFLWRWYLITLNRICRVRVQKSRKVYNLLDVLLTPFRKNNKG